MPPPFCPRKNSLLSFAWEPPQTESLAWHWSFWTLSDLNFMEDNGSMMKENLKPNTSLGLLLTTRKPWAAGWTSKGEVEESQRSRRLRGTVFKTANRPFPKGENRPNGFSFATVGIKPATNELFNSPILSRLPVVVVLRSAKHWSSRELFCIVQGPWPTNLK